LSVPAAQEAAGHERRHFGLRICHLLILNKNNA